MSPRVLVVAASLAASILPAIVSADPSAATEETVTRVADTAVPEADYRDAAAAFPDKKLADLTIAIALMNAYNRLAVSFRTPPSAAQG